MLSRRHLLLGLAVLPVGGLATLAECAPTPPPAATGPAGRLIAAGLSQIGVTRTYDSAYRRIGYPGGDVEPERGVCCDVVIRAYRAGLGLDLQKLVHEDMSRDFAAYPPLWGLRRPDANIDHRRVPNLATFFRRRGAALGGEANLEPGDIVTQVLPGNLPHIMIVSDRLAYDTRRYKVIHNIGRGTELADAVADYPVTGHFRYLPGAASL
jgi:uncharacterized protein YijF (DUF1287 family)